jgi:hypothetical protein
VAQVRTTGSGIAPCAPPLECLLSWGVDKTESAIAYGGGIQLKFERVALRGEYERTDTEFGHPGLLSIGVSYTF